MAKRGRPRKHPEDSGIHKISRYKPKTRLATKSYNKIVEERLRDGYIKLYTLAHDHEPNQREMHEVMNALRQGLDLL